MELRQIKHFVSVVRNGSFTRAAEETRISQPALSASIAKLERELEVRLLDRSRSQVKPTVEGGKFMDRASRILEAFAALPEEVREAANPRPLRIGVLRTMSTVPVSSLLRGFRRSCPNATLTLFEGDSRALQDRLDSGYVDAIITNARPTKGGARFRYLFKERFVLAVPIGHRLAGEPHVKLEVLREEALISRTGCEAAQEAATTMQKRRIKPRVAFRTDQDDRALSLVAAGIGVALVPEMMREPRVAQVPFSDFKRSRTISLQWNNRSRGTLLDDFVAYASHYDWTRPQLAA